MWHKPRLSRSHSTIENGACYVTAKGPFAEYQRSSGTHKYTGIKTLQPPVRMGTARQSAPEATVDLDAETVESTNEESTVPLNAATAATHHLITLFYPHDTSKKLSDKFPHVRVVKEAGQKVDMGRSERADVLLNDEHMPRKYAELWCVNTERIDERQAGDSQDGPKWFIKNKSQRKVVRARTHSGGSSTKVKSGEQQEIVDGCELKLEGLTFIVKLEDGDLDTGNFEVEIRPQDEGNAVFNRQQSTSTSSGSGQSDLSVESAAELARREASGTSGSSSSGYRSCSCGGACACPNHSVPSTHFFGTPQRDPALGTVPIQHFTPVSQSHGSSTLCHHCCGHGQSFPNSAHSVRQLQPQTQATPQVFLIIPGSASASASMIPVTQLGGTFVSGAGPSVTMNNTALVLNPTNTHALGTFYNPIQSCSTVTATTEVKQLYSVPPPNQSQGFPDHLAESRQSSQGTHPLPGTLPSNGTLLFQGLSLSEGTPPQRTLFQGTFASPADNGGTSVFAELDHNSSYQGTPILHYQSQQQPAHQQFIPGQNLVGLSNQEMQHHIPDRLCGPQSILVAESTGVPQQPQPSFYDDARSGGHLTTSMPNPWPPGTTVPYPVQPESAMLQHAHQALTCQQPQMAPGNGHQHVTNPTTQDLNPQVCTAYSVMDPSSQGYGSFPHPTGSGVLPAAPPVSQLVRMPVQVTQSAPVQATSQTPASSLSVTRDIDSGFQNSHVPAVVVGNFATQDSSHTTQVGSSVAQPGAFMAQSVDQPGLYMAQSGSSMAQSGSSLVQTGYPTAVAGSTIAPAGTFSSVAPTRSMLMPSSNGNVVRLRTPAEDIAPTPPPSSDFSTLSSVGVHDLQAVVRGGMETPRRRREPEEDDERAAEHEDNT